MKFSTAATFAAAASLAAARPFVDLAKRTDETGWTGASYTGTLVSPSVGTSFPLGGNITFSYKSTPRDINENGPKYASGTLGLNVGLQGPSPIIAAGSNFLPWGILELGDNLNVGGPGGWVNGSVTIPSAVTEPGEYFLIFEERQFPIYDSEEPHFRVQSYNVSIQLTEASA
ncbi:hypothetical protein JCM11251_002150 [Rhodosporidiobolus azoricus]